MASTTRGVALNSTLIVVAQSTQAIAVGAIALFLPLIRSDLGLSFSQAGLLAAVATLSYALLQIPAGVLADRVSPKLVFALGILGANVLAIAFALSTSFPLMLVTQAVGGVFRAFMFIPGMILITRHFSEARRATALGLFVAGGFSSNILVNLAGPLLVDPLGWRGVIVLSSVLGLVVLATFWLLGDDGPPREVAKTGPTRWVWSTAAWWLLGVIQFARLWIVIGFTFWLPAFLIEDRGFAIAAAGIVVAVSSAITAPANIGGGILSDRLKRPLLVIGVSLGAMTVLLAVLGELTSIPLMLVVVGLLAVFIQLYFGPLFAVPARIFGPGLAGLSSGFGNLCANLGGFASALLLGVLRDATGSFTLGFLALAAMALIGLLAVLALWRTGPARGQQLTS
jgi:DHA1 family inner membrane transport protein